MDGRARRFAAGVAVGVAALALGVFFSWVAVADTSPMSWITPYAVVAVVGWLLVLTLGVALAVVTARRAAAGVVVAVLAVPAYVLSMALTWYPDEGLAVFARPQAWVIATVTVAIPAAFGLAFGQNALEHREGNGAARWTRGGRA